MTSLRKPVTRVVDFGRGPVAVTMDPSRLIPFRHKRGRTLAPRSDMDTSLAAARAIVPDLQRLEAVVLADIARCVNGATDYEIECHTGLKHQTASARRRGR